MSILLSILKILGILQATYGSYVGLTQTLKNPDGTLTKQGKIAKYFILIGCFISLSAFLIEMQNKKESEEFLLLQYPITDFKAEGKVELWSTFFTLDNDYLDKPLELFKKLEKRNPDKELINYELNIIKSEKDHSLEASIKYDENGKPKYIIIPEKVFLNAPNNKPNILFMKMSGEKTGFTLSDDSFLNGKIDFNKVEFDLIYQSKFQSIKEILYDVNKKTLEAIVEYDLKLIQNNGKIKNLKQLLNAFCIKDNKGSKYFNLLHVDQKGYNLTPTILDTLENSNSIKLKEDELLYKLGTKEFVTEYLLLRYESKEISN